MNRLSPNGDHRASPEESSLSQLRIPLRSHGFQITACMPTKFRRLRCHGVEIYIPLIINNFQKRIPKVLAPPVLA